MWNILKDNPIEGEMYNGQLLELLIRHLEKSPQDKNLNTYLEFMEKMDNVSMNIEWDVPEDYEVYQKLVKKLKSIFCDMV